MWIRKYTRQWRIILVSALCFGSATAPAQVRPAQAQGTESSLINSLVSAQAASGSNRVALFVRLLRDARGADFPELLKRVFGSGAAAVLKTIEEHDGTLFASLDSAVQEELRQREEEPDAHGLARVPSAPLMRAAAFPPGWLPALPFRVLHAKASNEQSAPDIRMETTDKEVKASGTDSKNFETPEAKGTRRQSAETRYVSDGTVFGVEIKSTQVIEAVSKLDGSFFRKEVTMSWGAEVAACPDANGVTAGKGRASVLSKTTLTQNGSTITMTSSIDLNGSLKGHVNDKAEFTHYDAVIDAYLENAGHDEALRRNLTKEVKINDGRYGLRYVMSGNTIEASDGKYGGQRTPAKMGKISGSRLTSMTDAQTTLVGSVTGGIVPSLWNSANEMYKAAQRHWRSYMCVEVNVTAAKTTLKPGETVSVTAETVHSHDGSKVNADLEAEGYNAAVTPSTKRATPKATFSFTQEGEEASTFTVESVSRRGIGKGELEFDTEQEPDEPAELSIWTGSIAAERKYRENRDTRSGSNLVENGGYLDITTSVKLRLNGKLDRSDEDSKALLAVVTGTQKQVDHEYDRYRIDEGYCGPNAVPYKGPKEITRTSTLTVDYNKETRVVVSVGRTSGSISFSLPDQSGTTVHQYTHKSPCPENDRANTSEATDEDISGVGGSFSVSFPVDPKQSTIQGTTTVRGEDGTVTTYRWELTRRP